VNASSPDLDGLLCADCLSRSSALRDAGRAIAESTERKAQVAVLVDTVETLHAGGESERDQRIVSLTAQLAASRTGEAVLEARAGEVLAEAEARQVMRSL
jgi:hypothetical protein